jgi:hypothetical protein
MQMLSKIQAIIKDEKKQKFVLLFAILLFLLVSYFAGLEMGLFRTAPVKKNVKPANPEINMAQSSDLSSKADEKSANKNLATKAINIAQIYPFVTDGTHNVGNTVGTPVIPSGQARPNVGNIPLPAIPSNPAMNMQTSLPMPIPGNISNIQKQSEVTGVFTSQDGQNMAIMSDGKIVKEGEAYNSNQISKITNNGIHFDNGDVISYGVK